MSCPFINLTNRRRNKYFNLSDIFTQKDLQPEFISQTVDCTQLSWGMRSFVCCSYDLSLSFNQARNLNFILSCYTTDVAALHNIFSVEYENPDGLWYTHLSMNKYWPLS